MYFWSYRDDGAFHEKVTNTIVDDIVAATEPRFVRITAQVVRARRHLHQRRRRAPHGRAGRRAAVVLPPLDSEPSVRR